MLYTFGKSLPYIINSVISGDSNIAPSYVSVPKKGSEPCYLLVDIEDLGTCIKDSKSVQVKTKYGKEFAERYLEIENKLSRINESLVLNPNGDKEMIPLLTDEVFFEKILKTYNLFTLTLEEIQLIWFSEYKLNTKNIPVMMVPFSHNLYMIKKDHIDYSFEDEETLYLEYKYIEETYDKLQKISIQGITPYTLFSASFKGNPDDINLPAVWDEAIIPALPKDLGGESRHERLSMIKMLYSEYTIQGFREAGTVSNNQGFILNSPLYQYSSIPFSIDFLRSGRFPRIDFKRQNLYI